MAFSGHKDPIDLAGHRWDLPIFLIDAIFRVQQKRRSSSLPGSPRSPNAGGGSFGDRDEEPAGVNLARLPSAVLGHGDKGLDAAVILADLQAAIEEGFATHALQRTPHLVLLDSLWYVRRLKPTIAKWALLWLWQHFVEASVRVSSEVLLQYLCAASDAEIDACREQVTHAHPLLYSVSSCSLRMREIKCFTIVCWHRSKVDCPLRRRNYSTSHRAGSKACSPTSCPRLIAWATAYCARLTWRWLTPNRRRTGNSWPFPSLARTSPRVHQSLPTQMCLLDSLYWHTATRA